MSIFTQFTTFDRGSDGKPILPRSLTQKRYVTYMRGHALTFGMAHLGAMAFVGAVVFVAAVN